MPGVFGIIAKRKIEYSCLEAQFNRMASLLKHFDFYSVQELRGKDFLLGRIGIPFRGYRFAHRNEQSNCGIVYDGYIYGWEGPSPLPADPARSEPISFLSSILNSDLQSIPESLNGSFNMVLFDEESDTFYIANDWCGYRNLYYYENDDIIALAPEIKAFLALDGFRAEIDPEGVSDFFNYCFLMGDRTLYKGVKHLIPASILKIKNRKLESLLPYWNYRLSDEIDGDADRLMKEMCDLAGDILGRQMRNHENFIMALSGGMDSRVVAWLSSKLGKNVFYYTHGLSGSDDVVIARQVARRLGVEDKFLEVPGDPECFRKIGAWTTWVVDGMIDLSCCFLAGVVNSYRESPLEYEFLNSIFVGGLNFASAFGRASDIVKDLPFEEKVKRVKATLGAHYFDENYYNLFTPEYKRRFQQSYDRHLAEELLKTENISEYFINQKDVFFGQTRDKRLSAQYDLNRFFYHDHYALNDYQFLKFYLKMPMRHKTNRWLYLRMFQTMVPEMAGIKYQKTGVDLYRSPSRFGVQWKAWKDYVRHYIGRLSLGTINLYDYNNYVQLNQWYRIYKGNRRFFESILLDKRTLERGYYNEETVRVLLKKQARGSTNFNVISSLATFELFNRYFIDGQDPPKFSL
jgi:asparagine synthase (glutamine-hydrolysing)